MHVAITADSVDPERVNVIEVWRNAEALSKWRKQSKPPKVDKRKHVEVKRYDATDGGPLFWSLRGCGDDRVRQRRCRHP
jgi:hypothetical protein